MTYRKVFVIQANNQIECSLNIRGLIEKLQNLEIECLCVDMRSLDLTVSNVIFMENFDLELIETLSNVGFNIYSTKIALHCLKAQIPLPKSIFPLFCLYLSDKIVCCTEVSKDERSRVSVIVRALNGVFSKELTSNVTHLISGKVGSKKYELAKKLGIPVMKPSWIYEIWSNSEDLFDPIAQYHAEDRHQCGCFYGLVISVTGFDPEMRSSVRHRIESNDGIYSPELIISTCTHLIVGSPKTPQKISAAKKWNIPCVTLKWLEHCINLNQFVNENTFLIKSLNDISPALIEKSRVEETKLVDSRQDDSIDPYDQQITAPHNIFKSYKFFLSTKFEENKRFGLQAMIYHLGGNLADLDSTLTHFITDWFDEVCSFKTYSFVTSQWVIDCYKTQTLFDAANFAPKPEFYFESNQTDNSISLIDKENVLDKSNSISMLGKRLDVLKSVVQPLSSGFLDNIPTVDPNKGNKFTIECQFEKFNFIPARENTCKLEVFNPTCQIVPSQTQYIQYEDKITKEPHFSSGSTHYSTPLPSKKGFSNSMESLERTVSVPALPDTSVSLFRPCDIFIQFSSFDESTKFSYAKIVQKLRGRVLEGVTYDPNCTHMIVGTMVRSEKLMCAIAAGKWILKPTFIDSSEFLGVFCNERSHEWGLDPSTSELAKACSRWRVNKNNTGKGAFGDWVVLLCMKQPKFKQFKQILVAGDAQVIEYTSTLPSVPITHAIIDKNARITANEFDVLKRITPFIYKPEIILEYLSSVKISSFDKFSYTLTIRTGLRKK